MVAPSTTESFVKTFPVVTGVFSKVLAESSTAIGFPASVTVIVASAVVQFVELAVSQI